jgi:hypothetical protein
MRKKKVGRPKKHKAAVLNDRLVVRVTRGELGAVSDLARDVGQTTADYTREQFIAPSVALNDRRKEWKI